MHKHHVYRILAGGLLWAGNAFADIIWSGEQNLSGYIQDIDLNFDSLIDLELWAVVIVPDELDPSYSGVIWAIVDDIYASRSNRVLVAASNGSGAALPYGTLVSGTPDLSLEWKSGPYATGGVSGFSSPNTEWEGLLGETGEAYLGIAFDVGESTHYGWIHVILGEVDPNHGFKSPITASWAYESTPDTAINAGVIPEPSTGILTMVGSLGLLLHARLRRREKQPRLPRIPAVSIPPKDW
jgi:hypothetical protein